MPLFGWLGEPESFGLKNPWKKMGGKLYNPWKFNIPGTQMTPVLIGNDIILEC